MVTQDTYLFHGTVAENLRFGNPSATQEELEAGGRHPPAGIVSPMESFLLTGFQLD